MDEVGMEIGLCRLACRFTGLQENWPISDQLKYK